MASCSSCTVKSIARVEYTLTSTNVVLSGLKNWRVSLSLLGEGCMDNTDEKMVRRCESFQRETRADDPGTLAPKSRLMLVSVVLLTRRR